MRTLVLLFVTITFVVPGAYGRAEVPAAGAPRAHTKSLKKSPKKRLRAFRSERELKRFLRKLAGTETRRKVTVTASAAPAVKAATPVEADASAPSAGFRMSGTAESAKGADESVTNVQHAGVDEGGIVKLHGTYLLVLRRGRLFTIDIGGGTLRPVSAGAGAEDLHFTSVRLRGGTPQVAGRHTRKEASQGELRSHGFFYRPEGPDSGLLGLPISTPGRPGFEHLFEESAAVLFLRNDSLDLKELGELAARPETAADDECRASCVDWYGNARPLFLRGRVFALLGYELVEGALSGGRFVETRRVSYAPRPAQNAAR